MLDFRKTLLTFAAVGLFAGVANAQVAQLSGVAPVGIVPTLAVEGTTELLPDIDVTFLQPNSGVTSATLVLTSNVPFTMGSSGGALDVTAVLNGNGTTPPPTITLTSPTTVQVSFASISATPLMSITVRSLRVNASMAPSSSAITIAASGITGGGISGSVAAQNVAFVLGSQSVPAIVGQPNVSLCSTTAGPGNVNLVAKVTVGEGFAPAFKLAAAYSGPTITAGQGTVLAVTFSNLVSGVNYYVPTAITDPTGLQLTAYTAASGATLATGVTVGGQGNLVLLTASNGSATAYYGVTGNAGGITSATIPLSMNIPTASAVTGVTSTPVAVSVSLVGGTTGYPMFVANAKTATQLTDAGSNGLLTPCTTTLLFPYLVNTAGYDTGISIANTSTVPSNSVTAHSIPSVTPQAGNCTMTFYGTAAPSTPYDTGVINTGTNFPFLVSGVAPGFDGYAVAVCNFQGAQGYAFLADGFGGGGSGLSNGYLAVVQSTNP